MSVEDIDPIPFDLALQDALEGSQCDTSKSFRTVIKQASNVLTGSETQESYLNGTLKIFLDGHLKVMLLVKTNDERLIIGLHVSLYVKAGSTGFAEAQLVVAWRNEIVDGLEERLLRLAFFYHPWGAYNPLTIGPGQLWASELEQEKHCTLSSTLMPAELVKQYRQEGENRNNLLPKLSAANERTAANCHVTAEKIRWIADRIVKESSIRDRILHSIHTKRDPPRGTVSRITAALKEDRKDKRQRQKKLAEIAKDPESVDGEDDAEDDADDGDDDGDDGEDDDDVGGDGDGDAVAEGNVAVTGGTTCFYNHSGLTKCVGTGAAILGGHSVDERGHIDRNLDALRVVCGAGEDFAVTATRTISCGETFWEIGDVVDLPKDIHTDLETAVQISASTGIVPRDQLDPSVVPGADPFSFFVNAKTTNHESMGNCKIVSPNTFVFYKDVHAGGEIVVFNFNEGEDRQGARKHKLLGELTAFLFKEVGIIVAKRVGDTAGASRLNKIQYKINKFIKKLSWNETVSLAENLEKSQSSNTVAQNCFVDLFHAVNGTFRSPYQPGGYKKSYNFYSFTERHLIFASVRNHFCYFTENPNLTLNYEELYLNFHEQLYREDEFWVGQTDDENLIKFYGTDVEFLLKRKCIYGSYEYIASRPADELLSREELERVCQARMEKTRLKVAGITLDANSDLNSDENVAARREGDEVLNRFREPPVSSGSGVVKEMDVTLDANSDLNSDENVAARREGDEVLNRFREPPVSSGSGVDKEMDVVDLTLDANSDLNSDENIAARREPFVSLGSGVEYKEEMDVADVDGGFCEVSVEKEDLGGCSVMSPVVDEEKERNASAVRKGDAVLNAIFSGRSSPRGLGREQEELRLSQELAEAIKASMAPSTAYSEEVAMTGEDEISYEDEPMQEEEEEEEEEEEGEEGPPRKRILRNSK